MSSFYTIDDFNAYYLYRLWKEQRQKAYKAKKSSAAKSILFYATLALLVLLAFFYSSTNTPGKHYGPFAYNVVLTTSMQSIYPQGSLITSWALKPEEELVAGLDTGTDIVFVREGGMVVVHRIIEIIEDYEDSGQKVFRTQGIDNPAPDTWITYEGNVIGKVTGHVPYLGAFFLFISENLLLVTGTLALFALLFALLQFVLQKDEPSFSSEDTLASDTTLPFSATYREEVR